MASGRPGHIAAQTGGAWTTLSTQTHDATWWNYTSGSFQFTDTTSAAGKTYQYRVSASDNDGNKVTSDRTTITVT